MTDQAAAYLSREGVYPLGDVMLQGGEVMPQAAIAYAAHGVLNAAADNCILIPTYYTGRHAAYARMIGPGRALDPERFFIVVADLFGNGLSTSPSHRPPGAARGAFPRVGVIDNVACQRRLLFDHLGVRRIRLVTGWSMGAMHALWWGALHPELVEAILPICGTANCWPINQAFLEGVCAALRADSAFSADGLNGTPVRGLRAFGRAYAGWAYSAAYFREALYRELGCSTLEAFLQSWEEEHLSWDPSDLLAMAATWRSADIGAIAHDGDFRTALSRISARTIFMPCDQDAYFTVQESKLEAAAIPGAEVCVISSPYGHCAGAPGRFPRETAMIEAVMVRLLLDT